MDNANDLPAHAAGHDLRIGLCLCGGGITGAMFQVGCLAALEDRVAGFRADRCDVLVGSASGATVAMALAGGLSVQRMYRALLNPADDFFPLHRNHLMRLDLGELRRVLGSGLLAARRAFSSATSHPLDLKVWNELERFVDSLPAGIFALDAYERFLTGFMERRGIPTKFAELPRKLLVVAHELDTGERMVFGSDPLTRVPVARAVVASCATPILYAPVEVAGRDYVDGGIGDVAHIDLAAQEGCDVVLVINPMVPVRSDPGTRDIPTGHGRMKRVRDKGLLWVYHQTMRIRVENRLQYGIEHFSREHPELTIGLLEPEPSNTVLFMYSPMNFAARRRILEEGYTSTIRQLKDPEAPLTKMLRARGFRLLDLANGA